MSLKSTGLLALLVGGVGAPIAISKFQELPSRKESKGVVDWIEELGIQPEEDSAQTSDKRDPQGNSRSDRKMSAGMSGRDLPVSLQEVLRFDRTTAWLFGHFDRVTTGLADVDLQGYRVALVTGTSQGDLTGALTYYFDKQQKLRRITLVGSTGDARPIVSIVTGRFQFKREHDDPSTFVYRARQFGKSFGELAVIPAEIVTSEDPHNRFEIRLELDRPRGMD